MSHSTRVRGLKYGIAQGVSMTEGRTLHECVDWNFHDFTYFIADISRTLHECVDWNDVISEAIAIVEESHSTRVRGLK